MINILDKIEVDNVTGVNTGHMTILDFWKQSLLYSVLAEDDDLATKIVENMIDIIKLNA